MHPAHGPKGELPGIMQRETVILVSGAEEEELRLLLEACLSGEAEVKTYSALSGLFPDILKTEPVLALLDARSIPPGELVVIRLLKNTYPFMRIIVVIPAGARDAAARSIGYGADAYILEPFYLDELSTLVRSKFRNAVGQLRRSIDNRLESLTAFVEGLAPEINNPLTTIRGFLQILLSRESSRVSEEEIGEIYDLMERESLRINQIVVELENFARIRRPRKVPLDIRGLLLPFRVSD